MCKLIDHNYVSKEELDRVNTKLLTYTCSRYFIHNSVTELGVKCPSAGVSNQPLFLTFINTINCKITKFSLLLK